ncbi:MAG: NADH-quinone oxidoreductase subunit C [Thermoprotei archaeon]|nr:NADH-quinone oxidoreductase subunit C [TACK group archaeon]
MSNEQLEGLGKLLADKAKVAYNARSNLIRIDVQPEALKEVALRLRDYGFDHCSSVTAVDYPKENRMEIVWHLSSYSKPELSRYTAGLVASVSRDKPEVASLVSVWEGVIFLERETHEMFGVSFVGHPDQRPLLLPEELMGIWPLRKDYQLKKRREDLFKKGGAAS